MERIREVFALNLIRLRGDRTQAEVAEAADIPFSTYQKLEAGQLPRKEEHLAGLVRAFDLKTETALFLDPDLVVAAPEPTPEKVLEVIRVALERRAETHAAGDPAVKERPKPAVVKDPLVEFVEGLTDQTRRNVALKVLLARFSKGNKGKGGATGS